MVLEIHPSYQYLPALVGVGHGGGCFVKLGRCGELERLVRAPLGYFIIHNLVTLLD